MYINKQYLSLRIIHKALELGDCPNMEVSTLGGKKWWNTIAAVGEWRVQQHKITRHCRILDPQNIRKAWGNKEAMLEKLKRLTRPEFLEPGDVIGVSRKRRLNIYDHYAVYVGNGRVIHYAAKDGDFAPDGISIHEAPIDEFLNDDKQYFVLYFVEETKEPIKIQVGTTFRLNDKVMANSIRLGNPNLIHLYSPEETIARARSRIGEKEYNLITNNCEHFAIWCKTGVEESDQVRRVVEGAVEVLINTLMMRR